MTQTQYSKVQEFDTQQVTDCFTGRILCDFIPQLI